MSLPILPLRWGEDVPGVDLIASLLDVQLFTFNLACLDVTQGESE